MQQNMSIFMQVCQTPPAKKPRAENHKEARKTTLSQMNLRDNQHPVKNYQVI